MPDTQSLHAARVVTPRGMALMVFDLQAVTLYPTHSGNLFSYAPRPVYDVLTPSHPSICST